MNFSKHSQGFWYASSERYPQHKEEAWDYFSACVL